VPKRLQDRKKDVSNEHVIVVVIENGAVLRKAYNFGFLFINEVRFLFILTQKINK